MDNPIEIPVKGAPLRVQWGASVANRLNAIGSFCPSGMLLSDGATGTGFSPLPKNLRDRRPPKLPGCFEIRAPKTRDASDPGGFDNPYFMVSGRMYAAPNLGEHESLADYRNVIVALSVGLTGSSPSASIVTRETFADLQELADDADTSVYPLYEFGPNGEVKCDLRNIPTLVAKEWMT